MNSNNMTGQWFGRSLSSESKITTMIVVNIEPRSPSNALLIGLESQYQRRTISDATIEMNGDNIVGKTFNFRVYDHASHSTIPIAAFYNQNGIKEQPPAESEYVGKFDGTKIAGTFKNNLNQTGTFELWRSFLEAAHGKLPPIPENPTPLTWEEFKRQIASFRSKGRVVFRGQHSNAYPLRTSFHRKDRNNLPLYLVQDVSRLRHQINALSSHYYQPTQEDLYGLLNLAQHHGFPTPFLDWTESPYVAAFFAFDCLTEKISGLKKRIVNRFAFLLLI